MNPRRLLPGKLTIMALSLLLGAAPLQALAHAKLVKSDPARRAVLKQPPAQVRLWFNEIIEPSFSTLKVLDASGKAVTERAAHVSPSDNRLLVLELPGLAEGKYDVAFEVLSVDGHTVKSGFTFTVRRSSGAR
jgi:methionine-rich copper-binding protein CopC